ncbi:MAG TPA: hypothetical protein V6C76_05060 [Drouetiella sp.]
MNQQNVALLKEQFEQLFPGKWLIDSRTQKNLQTGIPEIDFGVLHGLSRKRITEWSGAFSSGKTTVLRSIIARWCSTNMQVVYIDTLNRLRASDWAFVESGYAGASPSNMVPGAVNAPGKFWVVRNLKGPKLEHDAMWAVEQLIRSSMFDVVILDLAGSINVSSKISARLQRSLERSRTALILLKDEEGDDTTTASWGCQSRFMFDWSATDVHCDVGLSGVVSIIPSIKTELWKEGMSKNTRVNIQSHVSNCLFTHPQIPDRRTPKT